MVDANSEVEDGGAFPPPLLPKGNGWQLLDLAK
jgi:hypothetical protein